MNDLGTLLYADWRTLINDVRRALRSPGRIVLWTFYGLSIVFFFVSRALYRNVRGGSGAFSDTARADYLVCALIGAIALALAFGNGRIGIFRSRAEARFIVGSRMPAAVAIVYLQARESLGRALRFLSSLVYLGFILGPRHLAPFAVLADFALIIALLAAAGAINAPRRLASQSWAIVCTIVGIPLALAAIAPALRDSLLVFPLSANIVEIRRILPQLHPGNVLLVPSPLPIVAALALAATAIAVLAAAGRDAYPELYALSLAGIDRTEVLATRFGRRKVAVEPAAVVARLPAPPGVMIIVWKSIVEFRRTYATIRAVVIGAAIWVALGFGLARFGAGDISRFWATLFVVAFGLLFFWSVSATTALATEVRRPLFWLSTATLFERLMALCAARIWRATFTFELVTAGFLAGGGAPLGALALGVVMPAFVALMTSIGFAAFALMPNASDERGPGSGLRVIVAFFLLIPVGAIGGVVGAFFGALPSFAAMTVFMLAEAFTLVGAATWRIDGRIDRLGA